MESTQNHSKSFSQWKNKIVKENQLNNLESDEVNESLQKFARIELNDLLEKNGDIEPDRGDLDDGLIEWRHSKPNYNLANLAFMMGKCKKHVENSLEMIVQNAVKTWEMEASHKVNTDQWQTIVHEKYSVQANNKKIFKLEEAAARGNYNVLLDHVDSEIYDAKNESFESSHQMFQEAFEGVFPWEVIEVFTGPPDIVFSWRHWSEFVGKYEGNSGDGRVVNMNGFAQITVNENLKVEKIKAFYRPEKFIQELKDGEKFVDPSFAEQKIKLENAIERFDKSKIEVNFTENYKEIDGKIDILEIYSDQPEIAFSWKTKTFEGFAIVLLKCDFELEKLKLFYKN